MEVAKFFLLQASAIVSKTENGKHGKHCGIILLNTFRCNLKTLKKILTFSLFLDFSYDFLRKKMC